MLKKCKILLLFLYKNKHKPEKNRFVFMYKKIYYIKTQPYNYIFPDTII